MTSPDEMMNAFGEMSSMVSNAATLYANAASSLVQQGINGFNAMLASSTRQAREISSARDLPSAINALVNSTSETTQMMTNNMTSFVKSTTDLTNSLINAMRNSSSCCKKTGK